ncbi:hypothetical protein LTR36_009714 [Oleoguttula mirabilis]|uniref:Uncharacterized protein n=1 Tax=Oleoguttula mirabilis TaxID=1507867 RepID=A0AAV9J5D2_9PEZI|nr:hypothetical protein LTR36_009714 [Oleoguttula mirabilis]
MANIIKLEDQTDNEQSKVADTQAQMARTQSELELEGDGREELKALMANNIKLEDQTDTLRAKYQNEQIKVADEQRKVADLQAQLAAQQQPLERAFAQLTQKNLTSRDYERKVDVPLGEVLARYATDTNQDVLFLAVFGKDAHNTNMLIQPGVERVVPREEQFGAVPAFQKYEVRPVPTAKGGASKMAGGSKKRKVDGPTPQA